MDYSLGIDIGTTNISVLLANNNKEVLDIYTEKNNSIINGQAFESLQDPFIILTIVKKLVNRIINTHNSVNIIGIGISNQMHGILYIDKKKTALSPFYNWQDKRGNEHFMNISFSAYIKQMTSMDVFTGYGFATHFYNQHLHLIPENTYKIIDIGTFVAVNLANKCTEELRIHPSNAQSWGLFDNETRSFDYSAVSSLAIDTNFLPSVEESDQPIGFFNDIPIYQSLGDNQAGAFGIIGDDEHSILINIGTSAQLSFIDNTEIASLEKRPFINNKKLYVASSLCGGKSVDLLVHFILGIIEVFDSSCRSREDIINIVYDYISNLDTTSTEIEVLPYFYGSRKSPQQKAQIQNLTAQNFNLEEISIAMIQGIVRELYEFWVEVPVEVRNTKHHVTLTGGGAAIPLCARYIKEKFNNKQVILSTIKEGAAIGASQWIFYLQNKLKKK